MSKHLCFISLGSNLMRKVKSKWKMEREEEKLHPAVTDSACEISTSLET